MDLRKNNFRIWDSKRKMMGFTNWFLLTEHGWPSFKEADSPLMQWIGLDDCNGNQIFEGDIVQMASKFERWDRDRGPHLVELVCGAFYPFGADGEYSWDSGKYVEIIGNIYQNPELLKITNAN